MADIGVEGAPQFRISGVLLPSAVTQGLTYVQLCMGSKRLR